MLAVTDWDRHNVDNALHGASITVTEMFFLLYPNSCTCSLSNPSVGPHIERKTSWRSGFS